jgi:hypothetical protein
MHYAAGPKAETEFARIRPTNSLGPDFARRGRPTSRYIPVKKKKNFKVHGVKKENPPSRNTVQVASDESFPSKERFRWIAGSVKTEVFIWCPARASATYVFRYPFAVVRAKLATAKHRQAHLNKMGMGPWRTRD